MSKIKKVIIKIAVLVLNIVYLPFKCLKSKNKITYISRQSNAPSIDFNMLCDKIKTDKPEVIQVMLTKKIGKGIIGKFKYALHIFVQLYHIATSKVVIVDSYCIAISVLKHKKSLKVIQIWHALGAIKKFGYQIIDKKEGSNKVVVDAMKMHKNYDAVTCSSKVTARFFSEAFGVDINKFKIVGMPRVDYILNVDKSNEILEANSEYRNKKTIIYIPTFRKGNTVNVKDIIKAVDKKKYNLIIKLHPLDNTILSDKYVVKGGFSTYDLMKFADYIITDYSAVAIEASLLGKPLYLYVYDIDEYGENRGLNVNLTEELKTSTYKDIKDIVRSITKNSYDFEALKLFRNKYVETYDKNNTELVCNLIYNYL